MRQVNPLRSAIFDGFNGFKRSRTFWISKDHHLCVYKAFGRHTCSPGSVPAGTGISPVPTGTLPGGPRGPLEAIQTRRLCRVHYNAPKLGPASVRALTLGSPSAGFCFGCASVRGSTEPRLGTEKITTKFKKNMTPMREKNIKITAAQVSHASLLP